MEAGGPLLRPRIPTRPTLPMPRSPQQASPTGLSPSTAPDFHRVRLACGGYLWGWADNPTSRSDFSGRFSLGCAGFGRPYFRHLLLISFPPPTGMLRFGGFPHLSVRLGFLPRREVPFGYPRIYGRMRLPGAFRSLPRPSSAPEPSHPPPALFARCLCLWCVLAPFPFPQFGVYG